MCEHTLYSADVNINSIYLPVYHMTPPPPHSVIACLEGLKQKLRNAGAAQWPQTLCQMLCSGVSLAEVLAYESLLYLSHTFKQGDSAF